MSIVHKQVQKMEEGGNSCNLCYETRITLIPKLYSNFARKPNPNKKLCLNSFLNTDANILNKIIQVRFIPGMQDWLNIGASINRLYHFYQIKKKII